MAVVYLSTFSFQSRLRFIHEPWFWFPFLDRNILSGKVYLNTTDLTDYPYWHLLFDAKIRLFF